MALQKTTIIAKVRSYINEYVTTADDFSTETDALLVSHIEASARMTVQDVPLQYLAQQSQTPQSESVQRPDGRYYLRFDLPDDLVRFGSIVCGCLKRPIVTLLPKQHPSYAQQYSVTAGIGAGEWRPMGFQHGREVEIHSISDGETAGSTELTLNYVATPRFNGESLSVLDDRLLDIVALRAAALYLGLTGDAHAQAANEAAQTLITNITAQDANN